MIISEAFKELKNKGGFATRGKQSFFEILPDRRIRQHLKVSKNRFHASYGLCVTLTDLFSDEWTLVDKLPMVAEEGKDNG